MENLEERLSALEAKIDKFFELYYQSEEDFADSEFKKKHEDKLGPLVDKMKALNGDDFDIYKEARAEYKNYPDADENEFVDNLVNTINEEIAKVKDALGTDDVEVVADGDSVEVKADGEVIAAESTIDETTEDETTEDETTEDETTEDETTEDEDDEYNAFIEDLKNSKEYKEFHKEDKKDKEEE